MTKKRLIKFLCMLLAGFFITSIADAYIINDSANNQEKRLYQVFNETFSQTLSSSDELVKSYGLPDSQDDWWVEIGQYGIVKFTVRYAGYGQELGIYANGSYQPIVTNIQPGGPFDINAIIDANTTFAFVEKATQSSTTAYYWYSADTLNTIKDNVDHFYAFNVTNLYNAKVSSGVKRAWLIAFEDLPDYMGCDHDYNDLVVLVAEVQPTLIELSSFTAFPANQEVILQWSTESEIENAGFNLYRSESEYGVYHKINDVLITSQGSPTQGELYDFTDTDVQNRKIYYYKLEDIDLTGNSTFHGPVSATPRWIYGVGE